jgi:hypothetical protein
VNFKIGDRVSFLNEKGSGMVTHIVSNYRLLVMNEDGFEISYPVEGLVPLAKKSDYKMDSAMSAKWKDQKEEQTIKPPRLMIDEAWEIDLHLHELIDAFQQKSDYEKLMFQLNHFRKCMDAAILHRIKKVIFIHGVGKGTLKQAIIYALRDYDRVRHFDAPLKRYGFGALTVEFI